MDKHENSFKWAVYGISVATLLFVLAATFLIIRIIDGQWSDWKIPSIFIIIFFSLVSISAMFTSLSDMKEEMAKKDGRKDTHKKINN